MSTRTVQPVAVPLGPAALGVLPALREALNGSGPVLLPHAPGEPPGDLRPPAPEEDDADDPTVAVLSTSGSTGAAKGALLSASALLASASAGHDRLGGPGRWLLALPAHHVAGLMILVRSLVSGTRPVVLDLGGGFTPGGFHAAADLLTGPRRYTALVPTQLVRLLEAGGPAVAALAAFDAVLVGGAATPGPLLARARAAGVRVVTTYGMSETCGGCVYDGVPLDGVRVAVEPDGAAGGRILLGGPVLARGYRGGDPAGAFRTGPDGARWFRTDDRGILTWAAHEGQGCPGGAPDRPRLVVTGRVDDVIVTGGLKVEPAVVEAALLRLPALAEAVVVGVADEEWGQRVVAALVPAEGHGTPDTAAIRAHVSAAVGAHAAPRQVLVLRRLPLRGPGKPDRGEVARLAALDGAN